MTSANLPKRQDSLMAPLVMTAAILGIVQGIIWSILSMAAIFLHHNVIPVEFNENSSVLRRTIYWAFIRDTGLIGYVRQVIEKVDLIINPDSFVICMYIYIVLSICLLAVSSIVLWASKTENGKKWYLKSIGAWTGVMGVVCLLDLIMLVLLGYDYSKAKENKETLGEYYLIASGIVMTLAARGFVLWVVNVIFASILGKYFYKTYNKGDTRNQPTIDAYTTGPPTPWMLDGSSDFDNKAFTDDNQYQYVDDRNTINHDYKLGERREIVRELPVVSLRKAPPSVNSNRNGYWANRNQDRTSVPVLPAALPYTEPENRQYNYDQPRGLRTAKIGRPGATKSTPPIPAPDYSPPGSPQPRGVLRPQTNYMY